MTTLTDRSHIDDLRPASGQPQQRNRLLTTLVIVLALAAIGLGIWAVSERNQASDLSDDLAASEATVSELGADLAASEATIAELEAEVAAADGLLIVGGGPLTERQQEMLDVTTQYLDAHRTRDGDLAASYMTEDAVYTDDVRDVTYNVADRSLQLHIGAANPHGRLETFEPVLVSDSHIVVVGRGFDEHPGIAVVEFPLVGDTLIESVTSSTP